MSVEKIHSDRSWEKLSIINAIRKHVNLSEMCHYEWTTVGAGRNRNFGWLCKFSCESFSLLVHCSFSTLKTETTFLCCGAIYNSIPANIFLQSNHQESKQNISIGNIFNVIQDFRAAGASRSTMSSDVSELGEIYASIQTSHGGNKNLVSSPKKIAERGPAMR